MKILLVATNHDSAYAAAWRSIRSGTGVPPVCFKSGNLSP